MLSIQHGQYIPLPTVEYGSVDVDSALAVTHTPDVLDAQDVFAIVDGDLRVTPGRGGVYSLAGGDVRGSGSLLSGTVTAEARVFASQPEDEVAYSYDHNGLRVRKKMTRYGGEEETTEYTLHGKLVTHLVKRNVTAEYVETVDEMHIFYDAQSRPAMASLNGTM